MSRAGYREMLRATFLDDWETAEHLGDVLGDVPWKDSGLLVASLFSLVVELRFTDERSPAAVRTFVKEALTDAPTQLKPLFAEGVLRAALGDDEMLEGIPPLEGVQVQIALTHKIITDAGLSEAQVEQLLDRAEALLDESVEAV